MRRSTTEQIIVFRRAHGRTAFAELTNMVRQSVQHRRDRESLKESEMKFRRLFDATGTRILVWKLDHDGPLFDVNEKACSLLGYPRAELLTMKWTASWPRRASPRTEPGEIGCSARGRRPPI